MIKTEQEFLSHIKDLHYLISDLTEIGTKSINLIKKLHGQYPHVLHEVVSKEELIELDKKILFSREKMFKLLKL